MNKDRNVIIRVLMHETLGIMGLLFMLLALVNIFLYGATLPENPKLWDHWILWLYPIIFAILGGIFFGFALISLKKKARKFIGEVRAEINDLKKRMRVIMNSKETIEEISDSEFGLSSIDIDILNIVKESGGFIPILIQNLDESPFSWKQIFKSMAKLALLNLIILPDEGMKIVITSHGLDALALPRITYTSKIPEDLVLMIVHAELLYREKKYDIVILKCNNILERALRNYLIPTIPNYENLWNEKIDEEYSRAALNKLWNFYRKYTSLSKKWMELAERVVKYTSSYKDLHQKMQEEMERKLTKEMARIANKSIDVITDVRSRYAHDKPSEKYEKDAYRILKLTELLLGMLFEDFKENLGIRSEKKRSAEKML